MRDHISGGVPLDLVDLADRWVRQSSPVAGDDDTPVYELWGAVLATCPWVRGRGLMANYDVELRHIYDSGTLEEAIGAEILCQIRGDFFRYLQQNDVGMRHIVAYEYAASRCWLARLHDKVEAMRPARFRRGEFVPTAVQRPVHKWMH